LGHGVYMTRYVCRHVVLLGLWRPDVSALSSQSDGFIRSTDHSRYDRLTDRRLSWSTRTSRTAGQYMYALLLSSLQQSISSW